MSRTISYSPRHPKWDVGGLVPNDKNRQNNGKRSDAEAQLVVFVSIKIESREHNVGVGPDCYSLASSILRHLKLMGSSPQSHSVIK